MAARGCLYLIRTDQGAQKGDDDAQLSPLLLFIQSGGFYESTVGEALSQMQPKVYPTNTLSISTLVHVRDNQN